MVTVTSAEFQKNFGRYRDAAQREPVSITNHGRESLVMLSAEEFNRLKALDTRRAYHPADLPEDRKEALDGAVPPKWTAKFNHELDE